MKDWHRSKTLSVNVAILGLAYWFRSSSFYIDPMWFVWVIAAANIALRAVTRQPLRFRGAA